MQYTWHGDILQGSRQFGSCALLRGDDGNEVVAIASGLSSGIEIWNPVDGSIKVLNDTFPPISGTNGTPKLLSVNSGLELIFYETWHYHSRDDVAALPVTKLTCG